MKLLPITITASLALALSAPGARAQQSGQTGSGSTMDNNGQSQQGNASQADKTFVRKAMAGSEAEIKLGQMAQEKASSQAVRQFGQKMVQDHTQLNDQMKPIAEQLGISTPASVPPKDQALQAKLEGLSGDAFDKAYMSAMVKDHRKDLSEFKKEAKAAKSPQVKDAAEQGSQAIQQHLQMAEQVGQQVGAVGSNETNPAGTRHESTPSGPQ